MIATCQHCGKKYEAEKSRRKFCSLTCSGYGRENKAQKMPSPWLNCAVCLHRAGLGKRRIAKVIKTASAPTVLLRLKEALGDAYGQSIPLTRQKAEPKPRKQRPPPKYKSAMDRYYANHEASKRRGAENAKRRYHEKQKHDPAHKIRQAARNAVAKMVRCSGERKQFRSEQYLGCTFIEAKEYLQRQFKVGMTWENYATEWEIDHIMPLAAFDLTNPAHIKQASHYTNLRPLWKADNRIKSDKIINHQAILL